MFCSMSTLSFLSIGTDTRTQTWTPTRIQTWTPTRIQTDLNLSLEKERTRRNEENDEKIEQQTTPKAVKTRTLMLGKHLYFLFILAMCNIVANYKRTRAKISPPTSRRRSAFTVFKRHKNDIILLQARHTGLTNLKTKYETTGDLMRFHFVMAEQTLAGLLYYSTNVWI